MLPVRVVKLGGSLLDFEELAPRFRAWLAAQSSAVNVIIVGGGSVVDALCTLDRVHGLGDEASHWLAIHAMSVTAELAARLLPEAKLVRGINDINCLDSVPPLVILDVQQFMQADFRESPDPLPCSWNVTSDSIAARVADSLGAVELVLLKSTDAPVGLRIDELAAQGIVDAYFPRVAHDEFAVRLVNLRTYK
jgi:5-(aminomethyl)-3-furanmethanol phosphate kinase